MIGTHPERPKRSPDEDEARWEERLKVATSKPESLIEGEAQILSGAGEAKPRPVEARDVQPTIKIRLGWPVRMLVNKNSSFCLG